ncbi:MAG: CBS domain-containing protein [Thermoplasmata archaeon]
MTASGPSGPSNPSSLSLSPSGTPARMAHPPNGPTGAPVGQPLYGSLVGDIMIRDVVTVAPTATLRTAALLLSHKRISGMPVVGEDGKVLGVLSEKDIVRVLQQGGGLVLPGGLFDLLLEPSEARQKDMLARCHRVLADTEVKAAMTSPAQTILPTTPTVEAIRRMLSSQINRLPVVENGRLVGIVTRRDVLSAHLESS